MADTKPGADELRIRAILRGRGVGPAAATLPDAPPTPKRRPRDWLNDILDTRNDPQPGSHQDADPDQPPPSPDPHRIPPWWTGRHVDLTPDDQDEPTAQPEEEVQPDAQPHQGAQPDEEPEDGDDRDPDSDAQPNRRHPRLRIPTALRSRPDGHTAGPGSVVAVPAPRMSLLEAAQNVPPRIRWLLLHASAAAAGYRVGWVQYSTRTAAWIAENGLLNVSATFWVGCAIGCEFLRHRMRNHRLSVRWLAAVPISSIVVGSLLYGTGWQNLELPL